MADLPHTRNYLQALGEPASGHRVTGGCCAVCKRM